MGVRYVSGIFFKIRFSVTNYLYIIYFIPFLNGNCYIIVIPLYDFNSDVIFSDSIEISLKYHISIKRVRGICAACVIYMYYVYDFIKKSNPHIFRNINYL